MRNIEIHVAHWEPIHDEKPVTATIYIDQELPPDSFMPRETIHENDAEGLAEALFLSLPQGTFDRLLIELMRKKVSIYQGKTAS